MQIPQAPFPMGLAHKTDGLLGKISRNMMNLLTTKLFGEYSIRERKVMLLKACHH